MKYISFSNFYKQSVYFSIGLFLLSLFLFFYKGFNYNIDFTGGTILKIQTDIKSITKIPNNLKDNELNSVQILKKKIGKDIYELHLNTTNYDLKKLLEGVEYKILEEEKIGKKTSLEMKKKSVLILGIVFVVIFSYIWFRFNFNFSQVVIYTLIHDVVITMGFLILLNIEISLEVIAAILTVIGYSLNDTIIIQDRIREKTKGRTLFLIDKKILDDSLNEVLKRTIFTSLSTLFVIVNLIVFSDSSLLGFSVVLFIGILIGTYSSIFISNPILLFLTKRESK